MGLEWNDGSLDTQRKQRFSPTAHTLSTPNPTPSDFQGCPSTRGKTNGKAGW